MSLFKLKNLWIESFPQEQFDEHHLCIGNIDGMPALALGSFSGCLRIFIITQNPNIQTTLIYQTTFQSPIVSVQFVTHPQQRNRNTIGVLLFRKFIYLSLRKNTQKNNYQVKNIQINVQPAFAIQKNSLSIFTINSTVQYLNPLSIQQIKVSDPIFPFVRQADIIYYADGQQLVMIQNAVQQWRIIVGQMRDLFIFKDLVIVIGDNALWEVKQSHINKTKVLQEDVSCGTIIKKDTDYNIIVANFANQIFIYTSDYKLIWAMKADQVPVKICIFQHRQLFGALALLGQEGTVSISYVGSELPQTRIQPINQQIDFQKIQQQTQKMLAQLKNKQQDNQMNNKHQQKMDISDVKLSIKAKNPHKTQQIIPNDVGFYRQDGQLWCCQIQGKIKCEKQTIYDVLVSVLLPSNITCLNNNFKISSIKGSQNFQLVLLCSCEQFPYTNQIQVTLNYENNQKKSSVISQICELPINFQCSFKSIQLQQKPTNKMVFKASTDLPAFSQIFYEFDKSLGNSKGITVQLANGVLCSMGYNKNNTKVKIQTNFFSGLCFMFIVFNSRFQKLVKSKKIANNQLSIDDIPLQQFFTLMKDHFSLRATIKQRNLQLQKKCEEFRNTQKKLIIKMKQKVSSINNIDKLLEYTYQRLINAADAYQNSLQQIQKINHNLQIAVKFIIQLLFMKTKATKKCRQKVLGIIGYEKQTADYGWQQKILSNSGHYLNKKFNYTTDKCTFDQLYKTVLWVISKINSGQWNQ